MQFDWFEDIKEPGSGVAIEKWKSMEAFTAHFNSNHVKEFGELAKEWLAGPVVGRVLKPENVWAESKKGDDKSVMVVVVIHVKPEEIETSRIAAKKLTETVRKQPSCLRYDWY